MQCMMCASFWNGANGVDYPTPTMTISLELFHLNWMDRWICHHMVYIMGVVGYIIVFNQWTIEQHFSNYHLCFLLQITLCKTKTTTTTMMMMMMLDIIVFNSICRRHLPFFCFVSFWILTVGFGWHRCQLHFNLIYVRIILFCISFTLIWSFFVLFFVRKRPRVTCIRSTMVFSNYRP